MRPHLRRHFALAALGFLFGGLAQLSSVQAQSSTSTQSSSTSSTSSSTSLSLTTSNFTSTFLTTSNGQTSTVTSVIPTTLTLTPSATTSANATSTSNATASATSATPIALDTKISPGFGVLGAILIITGLPSAFWGHKNRWSSFFLIGFYSFSLACLALILKFGVLEAVNPPNDKIQGVFVLACTVAGVAGGGVAIFFWQQAKYFIGGWGGFAIGLWVQCFRNGGLIRPIGFRWILYIGLGVVGFCLCTLPKLHYHVLLASTAAVGASAFVLGIDCFTTAGLKEFYVWNLGFDALFPKFVNNGIEFPVNQMMEIELGLIGAFTLMGAAVQLRILKILQYKLKEISREQKRLDEELEAQAASRFTMTAKELAEWEKEHGRVDSQLSGLPLLKDHEATSPSTEEGSTLVLGNQRRSRYQSGLSELMTAPNADERQRLGSLPAIDLGADLESDIPKDFVTEGTSPTSNNRSLPLEGDLRKKQELMLEINNIRKSIDQLRSATPGGSSFEGEPRSRHHSFTSRRTLSLGFADALEPPSRPPRAADPRIRVQSMDLSQSVDALAAGQSISRPSSAPLDDLDWNEYVRERKLFQPPAGVSAPIATSASFSPQHARPSIAVPEAVTEALAQRRQRETVFETGGEFGVLTHGRSGSHTSSEERPLSKMMLTSPKVAATTSKVPVTILPPRKPDAVQQARPTAPRTRTFEELTERHREKLRDLQAPLTRAEREQAELMAARSRWEHSKEVEKQVMAKKEAEKAAVVKQRQEEKDQRRQNGGEHQRSLSADRLNKLPGTNEKPNKRQSVLKVEDWRRYQQEVETGPASSSQARRGPAVPFPVAQPSREPGHRPGGSYDRRRSSQLLPPS